jgi:hypothetical protein
LKRIISGCCILRLLAVVIAVVGGAQGARAEVPFILECHPATGVEPTAAASLCDALSNALNQSEWGKADSGIVMQLHVNTLRATAINVTLNLTGPDSTAHTINRAFSASDTTITPAMQDAFLQKLISAIPSDF